MSDDKLPLVNRLTLRAREVREIDPTLGPTLKVETSIKWDRKTTQVKALVMRELAVLVIEEGLGILRQIHAKTIPAGPFESGEYEERIE